MDADIKKFCPNCNQLYRLICIPPHIKGNLPVFLTCGHTVCEGCVKNILKFAEPIDCKVCHQTTEINTQDVTKLAHNNKEFYKNFPVNMFMLGELTMELIKESNTKKDGNENYYVDLKSIIQSTDYTTGECVECHQITTKMCQQCEMILCDGCFNKSHKNFIMFKNHVLRNIEPLNSCKKCKVHTDKTLDYYCKDCGKSICMDCFMVGGEKSCKNHDVTSMKEVNEGILEDLNEMFPKVDETFRRLTKTAVDVGNLLYNMEHETGKVSELTQMVEKMEQHFSKLNSTIQKHKTEIKEIITKLKCSEKESLYQAKDEITQSIKKAKEVLNSMSQSLNPKKLKQINLSVLLEDAKQIAETPWYLKKTETEKDNLNVTVNEEICNSISDYVKLEGEAQSRYSLCSTAELGDAVEIPPPPIAPVYPPELPRDVRQSHPSQHKPEKVTYKAKPQRPYHQQAPMFRSKTRSTSSLNSNESDASSCVNGGARFYEALQSPVEQPVMPRIRPVEPYVSKVQKQLHKGSQEVIYISHIVDPHNFFVQRACHQGLIKELFHEFRNAVSSPKPSIAHITEGKFYLVYNQLDGTWQRCRVMSVDRKESNKPICTVNCIDFGNTEVVSIDKLRLLQPARVQTPAPLAINCSLANCVPKSGAWTCDDSYLIQNIINNKQAVIYVRDIRQSGNNEVLVCDVTTIEDGVSLAHALVFHERARMPNPKLHYPKICGLNEKPRMFMVNNNLKKKSVEDVYITHIVNPDKFFVRERHLQSVYEKLCEDLELEYGAGGSNDCIYLPEVGMLCVVNMEKYREGEGAAWARGVVLELPGRARVRVLLADCGAAPLVHAAALRPPREQFATLRALATECHLAGVTPLNKKWSAASVALLQRFEDRVLELHVEDNRNRGSLGVTLYDKADDDVVCVNNEMIKHKFAISFGFDRNDENKNMINKAPLDAQDIPVTKKKSSQIKILSKNDTLEVDEDLVAKDKGPLRLEVNVLQYQSPSLIYVTLVQQQNTFVQLFEEIQKYYSNPNLPATKTDWKEDDRCCAFSVASKTWRRVVIVEMEGDNAKVFYTDFALVDTVPLKSLRELAPEFQSLGDAAIKCHLAGVMPAVGTEWPSLTKEYLKELLDAYKRVFITKIGNFKDKSMPVELWVYHTVQGGALEPDTSEWRCLNLKIIDQGLGVPDKTQEVPAGEPKSDDGDEMLSFLNVTGSVREWLQLEPLPMLPLVAKPESDDNTSPSTPELCEVASSSNTVFISDWLPAEPLPATEFIGVPTYIDNDGVVFLHQLSQADTLELIRKALDVRFKKPDPKAKYARWTVGEPCIALYFLDNKFYRGRVIEVNKEASTCFVQYVDYGNEEICSFENMRKSIVLHQIPVQSHKCILSRIRPTGNQWDRTTLDYIHKSIVEKHCLVKITGEPIGDLAPIELKYDKLWINDHLVDFEMAEYTDGSKAVVTKFVPNSSFKKDRNDDLKSDSGPDFIVDEPASPTRDCSFDAKYSEYVQVDWNLLMEEGNNEDNDFKGLTFMINDKEEFLGNVTMINNFDSLEIAIVHNDKDNLLYEEMFDAVQKESDTMEPLNGIFENKACISLFHEDGQWYRASILKQNAEKHVVKVRYVDYGNTEVVPTADVREINKEWLKLPPASIQVQLHNVKINPEKDLKKLLDIFEEKGPFQTKIVGYENCIAQVELKNEDGELIYDELIKSGYLI